MEKERTSVQGKTTLIITTHFSKTAKENAVDKLLQLAESRIQREISGSKKSII